MCVCSFPSFVRTILDVCFVSVVFCSLNVLAFLAPVSGKKMHDFYFIPYSLFFVPFKKAVLSDHPVSRTLECVIKNSMHLDEHDRRRKSHKNGNYLYIHIFLL